MQDARSTRRYWISGAIVAAAAMAGLGLWVAQARAGAIIIDDVFRTTGFDPLQRILRDPESFSRLAARSELSALWQITAVQEPVTEGCLPLDEDTPGRLRFSFGFGASDRTSARVYASELSYCRSSETTERIQHEGGRYRSDQRLPREPIVTDRGGLEVLRAALEHDAVRASLDAFLEAEGVRFLQVRNEQFVDRTVEYLLRVAPVPIEKWVSNTPIVAYLARYELESGTVSFEEVDRAELERRG